MIFIFDTEENQMSCQMSCKTLIEGPLSLQKKPQPHSSSCHIPQTVPVVLIPQKELEEDVVWPKEHLHYWEIQILRWAWEISIQEYHQEENRALS